MMVDEFLDKNQHLIDSCTPMIYAMAQELIDKNPDIKSLPVSSQRLKQLTTAHKEYMFGCDWTYFVDNDLGDLVNAPAIQVIFKLVGKRALHRAYRAHSPEWWVNAVKGFRAAYAAFL